MKKIHINLEKAVDLSYDITIGNGIFADTINSYLNNLSPSKIAVVTDSNIDNIYGDFLNDIFKEFSCVKAVFPAGEENKKMDTIMSLFSQLAQANLDRKSLMIAFGGGVTGDMAGFLASIYMRGIPFIQVPTSLLAMVDSSVGGKTGVDTPEGKNLAGAFYQPQSAIIDVGFLTTLPEIEFINGLAEIIKHSFIKSRDYFGFLSSNKDKILRKDEEILIQVIEKSCGIKARVVELDEKEAGLRQILNFGHTIGHAIENASDYKIPHGFSVALGMVAEAYIAVEKAGLKKSIFDIIVDTLKKFELLRFLPDIKSINKEKIRSSLFMDKKNKSGKINIVLLEDIGNVFDKDGKFSFSVSVDEIDKALDYIKELS
jgi:3-dehydroquinate synthase